MNVFDTLYLTDLSIDWAQIFGLQRLRLQRD
jgi:hypothetical protein